MIITILLTSFAFAPFLIAAAASGLLGAGEAIAGNKKLNEANALLKTPQPKYNIPQNEIDNQNLAENMAGRGLSTSAKQVYQNQADRGFSAALNTITKNGGSVNNVGQLYDQYNNDIEKFALYEEQAKVRNMANLMSQNKSMTDYLDKQWTLNDYTPWANKMQSAAQEKAQGQQMLWGGLGSIAGALGSFGNSAQQKQDTNNVFGSTGTPAGTTAQIPQVVKAPVQNNAPNTDWLNNASLPDYQKTLLMKTLYGG